MSESVIIEKEEGAPGTEKSVSNPRVDANQFVDRANDSTDRDPVGGGEAPSRDADTRRAMTLVSRAVRFLSHLTDIDALLQAALDEGMRGLGACRGLICLLNPSTGVLEVRHTAGAGWDGGDLSHLQVKDEPGGGITGHVAATAAPYYAPDVQTDPYYVGHWGDVRSELALPLLDTNGHTVGVFVLESDHTNAFDDGDLEFATVLSEAVSAALTTAYYRERERALIEVGKELSTIVDISDLMQKVVARGAALLRAQDCTLLLISDDRAHAVLAASYGPLREQVGQAIYRLGEGLTGWVAEFGQPIRVRDVREDPRWKGLHVEMPPEGIGAFLAVPVLGTKGTLGVLRVLRRKRKYIGVSQEFTESDQELLQTLASQVGVALENCNLMDRVIRSERLAAWGEMSARAAHMIGNRVFAIKGSLNELKFVLQEPEPTSEGISELVDHISRGITRLEEILREFRDFVVATQLQTVPTDINVLVREAAEESFPRKSCVRLELNLQPDLPEVSADPVKFRRALAELLENSLDFQGSQGTLCLSTRRMPASEPRDLAARLPSGELVVITLEDQGPGVPAELKEQIFSPFFSTRAKGMGLGLSIVSGIVQGHRGVIREVGVTGEGARFEIYLPALRDGQDDTWANGSPNGTLPHLADSPIRIRARSADKGPEDPTE